MSSDPVSRLLELVEEMKRRGLVRVALVYLAVAFVILQAAGLLVPLLLLPDIVTRAVLALLILGFPIALVVGWAYDLTPEGVRRASSGAPEQDASDDPDSGPEAPRVDVEPTGAARPTWLPASTALVVVLLLALAAGLWWTTSRLDLPVRAAGASGASATASAGGAKAGLRLHLEPPPGVRLTGSPFDVAISPDGRTVVFAGVEGDSLRLYQRPLDDFEARGIPGASGTRPFFSPNGRTIGYESDGRLWTVSLLGGRPRPLAEMVTWFGGAVWGSNDTIVYADGQLGLFAIPAAGGEGVQLTSLDRGGTSLRDPAWLVDGKTLLVTHRSPGHRYRVMTVPLTGGGRPSVLLDDGHAARYLPSAEVLLYHLAGELFARELEAAPPLDPGPPVQVLAGLAQTQVERSYTASADDGTLVYLAGSGVGTRARLVWVDTAGSREPLLSLPRAPGQGFRISPDGDRIVFHRQTEGEENVDLWIYETGTGHLGRVTRDKGDNWWPIWCPDGNGIVHNSNRASLDAPGSGLDLYATSLGPGGEAELLAETAGSIQPQSWTSDGTTLVFVDNTIDDAVEGEETLRDIWLLSLDGGEPRRRPFLRTRFDEMHPSISPDGGRIAYVSDESGEREVYVTTFPDRGTTHRVSTGGGVGPVWAPDGDALFFRSLDGDRVYRVPVAPGGGEGSDGPGPGEPRLMFEGSYRAERPWGRNYDLHPDGDRLLLLELVDEGGQSEEPRTLRLLLNALPEIQARVREANR